ncbi:MAG: indole-3-glycerol phosphate synthase TrpC [Solirubrobacteraceae bacterium]
MSVLAEILRTTREYVARRRAAGLPEPSAAPRAGLFHAALRRPGLQIIAEHKRRSPSAGEIRPGSSVADTVAAYEHGGAAACSILTEERNFDGSLDDLQAARAATALPLLRKDFIVDPFQLAEARVLGADAVLLIVAALEQGELAELDLAAREAGLDVLIEVHDGAELERALALAPRIIGVNNRDLRDFSVDVGRTLALLEQIPEDVVVVSESGLDSAERLRELEAAGVHAALIGESLMRAADPANALRALHTARA